MVDFIDQKIFEEIKKQASGVVFEDDVSRALMFVRNFSSITSKKGNQQLDNAPEIAKKYESIILSLRAVALASLSEKEVIDFFEKDIQEVLVVEDLDILEKVKFRVIVFSDFSYRDKFKRKLREALYRNKKIIGSGQILLDKQKVRPTVVNWLKKYAQLAGPKPANKIVQNQFLTLDSDVLKLTDKNKKALRSLVYLFEYLKTSSMTPEGLEDPVLFNIGGKLKVLKQGNFEDVKLPSSAVLDFDQVDDDNSKSILGGKSEQENLVMKKEILEAYQGNNKLQKAIAKEIKKLDKKFGSDKEALRAEFFQTTQKGNANRTVGALMLMTQNNELLEFIGEDPKLNKFLSAIWEKQYGADLVADFKINPTNIKYVKMFLQYVLEQRLKMDENDAARVGLQIGNAFAALGKKSYNKMAYFDVKTKEFNWFE